MCYTQLTSRESLRDIENCLTGLSTHLYHCVISYAVPRDISSTRAFNLLNLGNEILMKIEKLFIDHSKEIPTVLKLVYFPKTGKFESNFGYERNFSHSTAKTAQDIYEEWYHTMLFGSRTI
uniref:DUF4372 domain-containing protein n=2 Tax=unclassified Prevotella TaxID=2638335 RepID=A0AB33IYE5_9BACT